MFDFYLFDLDNTILHIPNSSEYFDTILKETLKKLTKNPADIPDRNERNKFWFSGDDYIKLLESWGVSDGSYFWKFFDEIDFSHRKNLFEQGKLCLYNDVRAVLKEISNANKKLGLISNTADYIVKYFLDKFDLSHFFHETFGLGYEKDQEVAKPSPEGILYVLKKLNYDSNNSRAIMIGDSRLDVFAAKRANITACLIKRDLNKYPNKNDWEAHPNYEIESLNELLKFPVE